MNDVSVLFEGFSPLTIDFLIDLKNNNNRDWFNANKDIYLNELKGKALTLINEMQYAFLSDGLPFNADMKKSLFRIYRDIRFSKDKTPYKTHLGIFFPYKADSTQHKPIEATGLYLHIEPNMCFIAGGLHRPQPAQLKNIRNSINGNYQQFKNIINDKFFTNEFTKILNDESLKRVPRGFPKEHPAADLLKLKGYSLIYSFPCDIIFSRSLISLIIKKAKAMSPFLEFLDNAAFDRTSN